MTAAAILGRAAAAAGILLLAACSREEAPPGPPRDPVVVYASYEDKAYLPRLFEAYTEATGVRVIVRQAAAKTILADVIDNDISPPADVLITPSVLDAHRAAEQGVLRPIDPGALGRVASRLRDPDGFWTAMSYRYAAVAYRDGVAADPGIADPAFLADPLHHGRLCLSSSAEPTGRLLIAGLIHRFGAREAEIIVRGWIANLARPVFASEAGLREALAEGGCAIGFVADGGSGSAADPAVRIHHLAPAIVDIEGIGIARHARNPAGALRLVEWLLSDEVQEGHAASVRVMPAIGPYDDAADVGALAWSAADAALLAERARYP